MATTSLLRFSLFPNPKSPNPNPRLSHQIRPPLLSRRIRRRVLRPICAVDILSPNPNPASNPSATPPSILLEVTGMMCGACAARVKSALAGDDRVDSAAVNMVTETAAVRIHPSGGDPDLVAEELARRLTAIGFPTRRRMMGTGAGESVKKWQEARERKEELLQRSRNRVAFAWTLVALCCGSHASHLLHSVGIHVAHGKNFESDPV